MGPGSGTPAHDAACLLRFGGATKDTGDRFACTWKTWLRHGARRWELRRVLPDVGFGDDTQHKTLHRHFNMYWQRWRAVVGSVGFDPDEEMGQSRRSLQASSASGSRVGEAEQEWWASTRALLCLLLHWCHFRKLRDVRAKCWAIGRALLDLCLDAQVASGIHIFDMEDENVQQACEEDRIGNDWCAHWLIVQDARSKEKVSDGASPQSQLWADIVVVSSAVPCKSATTILKQVVAHVSDNINLSVAVVGDFDWMKGGEAQLQGKHKRRRLDPHVRAWCTEAARSNTMPTHALAVRSLHNVAPSIGSKWMAESMALLRAEFHLSFRPQAISIATDCAR